MAASNQSANPIKWILILVALYLGWKFLSGFVNNFLNQSATANQQPVPAPVTEYPILGVWGGPGGGNPYGYPVYSDPFYSSPDRPAPPWRNQGFQWPSVQVQTPGGTSLFFDPSQGW